MFSEEESNIFQALTKIEVHTYTCTGIIGKLKFHSTLNITWQSGRGGYTKYM